MAEGDISPPATMFNKDFSPYLVFAVQKEYANLLFSICP
jgi:hypothetical protein